MDVYPDDTMVSLRRLLRASSLCGTDFGTVQAINRRNQGGQNCNIGRLNINTN